MKLTARCSALVFLVIALSTSATCSADGQVERLIERYENRAKHYHGLEFRYRDKLRIRGSNAGQPIDEVRESVKTFRLADPLHAGSKQHRFYWERTIENPGEPMLDGDRIVAKWVSFDGNDTRRFEQTLFTQDPNAMTLSDGVLEPQPAFGWLPIGTDHFLWFLTADAYCSYSFFRYREIPEEERPFTIAIVDESESLGRPTYLLEMAPREGRHRLNPLSTSVSRSGTPMLFAVSKDSLGKGTDKGGISEVTEVGTYQGVDYPAAGFVSKSIGSVFHDYEFEVLSVRALEPDEIANWHPEWPPGTSVGDQGTRKVTKIDYRPEQMDAIREYMLKRDDTWSNPSWGRLAFILLNTLFVFAIVYFLYRRIRFGSE